MNREPDMSQYLEDRRQIYITESERFNADIELILRDLAEDFVDNVCILACKLAKHRNSDRLEEKDVNLAISLLKPTPIDLNQL